MSTLTETTPPVSTDGSAQANLTALAVPSPLKRVPEGGAGFNVALERFKDDIPHPGDGYIDDPDVVDPPIETTRTDSGHGSDDEFRPEIVESDTAYDQNRLDRLCSRDIRDALEFETEFKDTFGFAWVDEEARVPLEDSLKCLLAMQEDGAATIPGMVVAALKVLLKGHPRGFGRYYSGKDPWPRPSSVVQAEIEKEMPFALYWLRFELKEALEMEGKIAPIPPSP
jgi:hypothetical protein